MAISLYDAVVPTYLQILDALLGLISKGEAHCAEKGVAAEEIIGSRLIQDMSPFSYQVKSTTVHSLGAVKGVMAGAFRPDTNPPPTTFAALRTQVEEAIAGLKAISVDDLEAFADKTVIFTIPGRLELPFTGQSFLLSFSQPNFYFHATTAYDLLRHKGVKLGKINFLGKLRAVKPA